MKKEELPHPDLGRYWGRFFVCLSCVCLFVARSVGWLVAWLVGWLVVFFVVCSRPWCGDFARAVVYMCGCSGWLALLICLFVCPVLCVCARVLCRSALRVPRRKPG